jgi:CelD/BcsL family acetyltransferase involved in cellulose biosynthesis
MPEWLLTWWRHFGSGNLRVLTFREANRLVGVIPLFLHEWEGRRQLTLVGSGISDYLEPPIRPELASKAACHVTKYLAESSDWDICNWQDLSENTSLLPCPGAKTLAARAIPDLPCSEIVMDRPFAQYWSERPAGLRRNVRRYRQKAEATSPVETRTLESDYQSCLDALIRLHSARWREHGEPGMIAANRSAAFLRDAVAQLASRQMVKFFVLHFQNQMAAVILAFPYRETIYAYLSAFDPAHASFGFGRILLFDALQYAFDNGFQSWNFLRGDEPYKFEWGAHAIQKTRLIIARTPGSVK